MNRITVVAHESVPRRVPRSWVRRLLARLGFPVRQEIAVRCVKSLGLYYVHPESLDEFLKILRKLDIPYRVKLRQIND